MENKSIKKIFDNDLVVDDLIRDISAAIPTARFIPQKTVIFLMRFKNVQVQEHLSNLL